MIIRKLYKCETAHLVRNCSTQNCKYSVHGHSAIIEVFVSSTNLDNGQMIVDFGLLKDEVKEFIESMDHCYILWSKESQEFKDKIKSISQRWIEIPVSPSVEQLSLMVLYVVRKIIANTRFANGETNVQCCGVRYHETTTGYAESNTDDLKLVTYNLEDIIFSDEIKAQWKNPKMYDMLLSNIPFVKTEVEQQINN